MFNQFELFSSEKTEGELLREELEKIRLSNDKVRKGLFARHNELAKMYLEMKQEFEDWKKSTCRNY